MEAIWDMTYVALEKIDLVERNALMPYEEKHEMKKNPRVKINIF